jgi:hypothetical protein
MIGYRRMRQGGEAELKLVVARRVDRTGSGQNLSDTESK